MTTSAWGMWTERKEQFLETIVKWTRTIAFVWEEGEIGADNNFCLRRIWKKLEQKLLYAGKVKWIKITTSALEEGEMSKNNNFCMQRRWNKQEWQLLYGRKRKEGKRKEHEQKDGDRGCNKENAQMRNGCAVLFGCTLVGGVCKLRSVWCMFPDLLLCCFSIGYDFDRTSHGMSLSGLLHMPFFQTKLINPNSTHVNTHLLQKRTSNCNWQ